MKHTEGVGARTPVGNTGDMGARGTGENSSCRRPPEVPGAPARSPLEILCGFLSIFKVPAWQADREGERRDTPK